MVFFSYQALPRPLHPSFTFQSNCCSLECNFDLFFSTVLVAFSFSSFCLLFVFIRGAFAVKFSICSGFGNLVIGLLFFELPLLKKIIKLMANFGMFSIFDVFFACFVVYIELLYEVWLQRRGIWMFQFLKTKATVLNVFHFSIVLSGQWSSKHDWD